MNPQQCQYPPAKQSGTVVCFGAVSDRANSRQDKQWTNDVTYRQVRVTILAVAGH